MQKPGSSVFVSGSEFFHLTSVYSAQSSNGRGWYRSYRFINQEDDRSQASDTQSGLDVSPRLQGGWGWAVLPRPVMNLWCTVATRMRKHEHPCWGVQGVRTTWGTVSWTPASGITLLKSSPASFV